MICNEHMEIPSHLAAPREQLESGIVVVNMCVSDDTYFDDGTILHGCSTERVKWFDGQYRQSLYPDNARFSDVEERFVVTDQFLHELKTHLDDKTIDIVLVPKQLLYQRDRLMELLRSSLGNDKTFVDDIERGWYKKVRSAAPSRKPESAGLASAVEFIKGVLMY